MYAVNYSDGTPKGGSCIQITNCWFQKMSFYAEVQTKSVRHVHLLHVERTENRARYQIAFAGDINNLEKEDFLIILFTNCLIKLIIYK